MTYTNRVLSLLAMSFLASCAPATLSTDDARTAMTARMERPGATQVTVKEIHALELSECTPPDADGAVACLVRMDVSFDYGGVTQRDADSERIRFVREGGRWTAQPMP